MPPDTPWRLLRSILCQSMSLDLPSSVLTVLAKHLLSPKRGKASWDLSSSLPGREIWARLEVIDNLILCVPQNSSSTCCNVIHQLHVKYIVVPCFLPFFFLRFVLVVSVVSFSGVSSYWQYLMWCMFVYVFLIEVWTHKAYAKVRPRTLCVSLSYSCIIYSWLPILVLESAPLPLPYVANGRWHQQRHSYRCSVELPTNVLFASVSIFTASLLLASRISKQEKMDMGLAEHDVGVLAV